MTLGDAAEPLVHIRNFRMDFGDTTVIRDLSFDVGAVETFGFLGSNGSGKTTTLRALLGIYRPTAGTLHIGGKVFEPRDGARLGYLPEERGLYKKEAVLDVMVYFGRLKGLTRAAARSWSENYLERVGIPDKAKSRLDKLSGGQQQKVQLGVTIMNNPELLILDEPTKGSSASSSSASPSICSGTGPSNTAGSSPSPGPSAATNSPRNEPFMVRSGRGMACGGFRRSTETLRLPEGSG
jgi:ABC-2 type transport system ATP-binding protein